MIAKGDVQTKYIVSDCRNSECKRIMLETSGMFGKDVFNNFSNANIDKYNRDLYQFLQHDWDKQSWLYIQSKTNGTGKSYTANAIANMLMGAGVQPIVAREVDMASQVQSTFDDKTGVKEYALMGKWKAVPVLIIQDFGKYGCKSEWWPQHIFDIVDYRVIKGLPIVITSNYDIEDTAVMDKRFGVNHGPAIQSRLLGQCDIWNMNGIDRRLGAVS